MCLGTWRNSWSPTQKEIFQPDETHMRSFIFKRTVYQNQPDFLSWVARRYRILPFLIFLFFFFFFFCFSVAPAAYPSPMLGVKSGLQLLACATATATPDLSHICDLHHSSQQHWIINPLREARDQTCVLMNANQIRLH